MFSISAPYSLIWALDLRNLNLRITCHYWMLKHHLFFSPFMSQSTRPDLVSISILFQVCFVEFASMLSHKTATKLPPPGLEENWKLLVNIESKYCELWIRVDVMRSLQNLHKRLPAILSCSKGRLWLQWINIYLSWKLIYAFLIMIKLTFYKWYGYGME